MRPQIKTAVCMAVLLTFLSASAFALTTPATPTKVRAPIASMVHPEPEGTMGAPVEKRFAGPATVAGATAAHAVEA
jgi:hypothetical protein